MYSTVSVYHYPQCRSIIFIRTCFGVPESLISSAAGHFNHSFRNVAGSYPVPYPLDGRGHLAGSAAEVKDSIGGRAQFRKAHPKPFQAGIKAPGLTILALPASGLVVEERPDLVSCHCHHESALAPYRDSDPEAPSGAAEFGPRRKPWVLCGPLSPCPSPRLAGEREQKGWGPFFPGL